VSKRTLYGEIPTAPGQAPRAPLPLVTQAMIAVTDPDESNPQSNDGALVLSKLGGSPQVTANLPSATAAMATVSPAGGITTPAVEIGLTQHSLPEQAMDERLVLLATPDSLRAAAFRVLRHHLMEVGHPKVILVTSARPSEGKTTTAINLALALAECGRAKVLLIDANLKSPQIATALRFVPPWCFAEQLAAHRLQPMLPWSLIEIPQLWIHVAGISATAPKVSLVDAPAFAIAIDKLRGGGYDHIVIDGPSVLGGAEVNLIQDVADGVVITTRGGKSTARDLRASIEQLSPGKILGTVLLE
jgi:Mrp family chromosome partitioning ATPase